MTSPVPGFTAPDPRTWTDGDIITVPRLRGDCANLGYLMAGGARPLLSASGVPGLYWVTPQALPFYNIPVNTWNVPALAGSAPAGGIGTAIPYQVPMAGWYLAEGEVMTYGASLSPQNQACSTGFTTVANGGAAVSTDGGCVPAPDSETVFFGPASCELYQFNTYAATGDEISMYVAANIAGVAELENYFMGLEWVGLPTSGLTGYTGPYGTVVASPAAAAPFPPGPGATLTSPGGVAAGGTTITVSDTSGIVTGGVVGLDWHMSQPAQPVAEVVTVTGVAGATVSISAAAYPHAANAPVAVPVSAAFLNQQVRDAVNFLAYPPLLRAQQAGAAQSLPTQALPGGSQITGLTATCDTFSGFSSNEYTVPVAGCYLTYGQVYYAGSTATFTAAAGLQVSGGTITWGTTFRAAMGTMVPVCATVRKTLRLAEGDTVALYGVQNSGTAMDTQVGSSTGEPDQRSKLIMVWRST